jgi:predicted metal-binding protein
MTRSKILAAAAASALALSFGTAASALTTFSLNSLNTGGFPAPYGTVAVDLTSPTMATVTFTAATAAGFNYFFIDSSVADVNVNAPTWTITGLTTNGLGGATIANGGSGNVDGWGTFNQTTNQSDGYADRATLISFVLTDTSGTWASSDNVLTPNTAGHTVAAHIAVCTLATNPTCGSDEGAAFTGFATNGGPPGVIPEPATWGLMLAGFFGAGALLRSRRKALAAA